MSNVNEEVIDNNVVEIKFDNTQFIENVSQTIDTVNALKESLEFDSSSFDSLEKATRNIDLSGISSSLESLSERFSTFGIVGMTAIQRITNEVMTLSGKLVKVLAKPWQQIITGGTNRAANIAQAQFQLEGLFGKTDEGLMKLNMTMKASSDEIAKMTGMSEDLIVAMNAADYAVADTAYGLDSAAKAASVLATSGVDVLRFSEDLKDANGLLRTEMQVALRSISGTAAMANASYDDIAHVFERISGNGRVMAIDLQSLSARGLNAAATLRDYLNDIGVTANATEKDIRDMVSKGQIDFMTFAKAMDTAYGDHAKDANNTFQGAFSNMKFALSKIGADFISPLREKVIPLFNDIRISINQVRKALNFKIQFPGLDKEISIVEMFTNAITRLTEQAHNLFIVWHGGQNVLEQTLSLLTSMDGQSGSFSFFKKIFDDVEKGSMSSQGAITILTQSIMNSGHDVGKVYKTLSETMDKTEDDIVMMCHNGEISLEQFANAISSTFGNTVAETRISQLANLLKNLLATAINLGNGISSVVGPIIEAFFNVFRGNGVEGIVGVTQSLADFTAKIKLSIPAQRNLVRIFETVFKVLKTGISIIGKLAGGVFKIIGAFSPLIDVVLNFAEIITSILGFVIDFVAQSKVLDKVIKVLTTVFQYASKVVTAALVGIIGIVGLAINRITLLFRLLSESIQSIDLSRVYEIIWAFKQLVRSFLAGGVIPLLKKAMASFIAAIGLFFIGIANAFANLKNTISEALIKVRNTGLDLIDAFTRLGERIAAVFVTVYNFIATKFTGLASIVAILESLLAFTVLYNVLKFGSAITRAVNSWANKNNAQALAMAADSIKKIAVAFLIFSAALVVLGMVDTKKVLGVIGMVGVAALAILGISFAVKLILDSVTNLNKSTEKVKLWEKAMSRFMDQLGAAVKRLSKAMSSMMKNIGKGVKFAGLAMLLISIAGSIYILYKAVSGWASIDTNTLTTGLTRMGIVVLALTVSVAILGAACKKAGTGLMGAAVVMLAFTAVLKGLTDVIVLYANLNKSLFKSQSGNWKTIFTQIAVALLGMAIAVGILGAACKKAGFGMMAGAIDMLAFLIVLKMMKDVIIEYSSFSWGEFLSAMGKAIIVMVAFGAAIAMIGETLNTEKSFSGSLKGGFSYSKSSQNFMGIILSLMAIAIVLKAFASTVKDMESADKWTFLMTFGAIISMLGMVVLALQAMKNVNNVQVKGLATTILALGLMISILSIIDPKRALASAVAMAGVIWAIGKSIESIGDFGLNDSHQNGKAIRQIIALLAALTLGLEMLGDNDWMAMSTAALSIGVILGALTYALTNIQSVSFDNKTIETMIATLIILATSVWALSKIAVPDPIGLLALATCMSILAIVMAEVTKTLSKVNAINGDVFGMFFYIIGEVSALSVVLAASSYIAKDSSGALLGLVGTMSALSLLATAIAFLLSKINVTKRMGDAIVAFASIMGIIAAFGALCAVIGLIGNVENTNRIMYGLTMAMTGLLPFLLITMSVLSVLPVNSSFFLGMAGFTMLLGLVASFGAFLAYIGKIGDVENTVTIMESLTRTMNGLLPFLLAIGVVISFLGMLGPMIMIGNAMFAILLTSIAGFAALLAFVGTIGNVENTVKIMESFSDSLRSMTITMLLLTAVGALAIPAIAGITILQGMVISLLGLFGIVGAFQTIQNAVLSGIALILFSCDAISKVTEIMAGIDLNGILTFITAVQMLSQVNLLGITRLALVNLSLSVAAAPLLLLNGMRKGIESGLETALKMVTDLVDICTMSKSIGNLKSEDIVSATNETLKVAKSMTELTSHYITSGYAHGLVDAKSKQMLESATVGMAAIVDNAFRNYMGIHSDSDLFITLGHYTAGGQGTGMTDEFAKDLLTTATETMGGFVNDAGINVFGTAGSNSANSFLGGFVNQLMTGAKDIDIEGIMNGTVTASPVGKAGTVQTQRNSWRIRNRAEDKMRDYRIANNIANYRSEKEFLEAQAKLEEEQKDKLEDNFSEAYDYGSTFTDLIKTLETSLDGLNTVSLDDLNGSLGGVGESAGTASKQTDKLISKIEDLMDEYEELWDQAKTNANKDLFKGVEGQGDEFLDSIQDIMDQYQDIYKTAVEKTNSQDLFAEVKEDNESFAPETLMKRLEDQVNQVNELNTIVASLSTRITDENLRAAISQMDVSDLPELRAMYRMSDGDLDKYQSLYKDKVQANQNKIQNELTGSLSQLTGEYTNVAEYIASDATTDILTRNLQAQIDQLNEYNATVGSLMVRIKDLNLREAIAHMGVDSLAELKQLNSMTDIQLDAYTEMYNQKIAREAQALKNELSTELSTALGEPMDISEFYKAYKNGLIDLEALIAGDGATTNVGKTAGTTLANGASEGISSNSTARSAGTTYTNNVAEGMTDDDAVSRVEANARLVLDTITNIFVNAYDIFKEIGSNFIDQMCAGIDTQRRGAGFTDTLSQITFTISNALVVGSNFRWLSIGENIVNGITRGMNSANAIENLEKTARSIAAKAVTAVRQELKIASPSRVFAEIGRYMDEGLAVGLRDYAYVADDAASDMALGTMNPIQEAISQLSGMLDGSIDINPTITPTLDLSQVNARSAALANMFSGRQIAVQARADEQQSQMMQQLGSILAEQNSEPKSITFNQTNNSPKPLNRTEIYRQTRNGFSQLVNAIS